MTVTRGDGQAPVVVEETSRSIRAIVGNAHDHDLHHLPGHLDMYTGKTRKKSPVAENRGPSTMFVSSEFLAEEIMEVERDERLRKAKDAAFLAPWRFSAPLHISSLYPLRYNMACVARDGSLDLPNLANLCEELRHSLQTTVLPSWQHLAILIPLMEEIALLYWAEPHMPQEWSFFAHCKRETLVSILIEVIEAVGEVSAELADTWTLNLVDQAWYTTPVGNVLERCYARRILIQPLPEDRSKYEKHIIYLLAAIELINTCCKSKRAKTPAEVFARSHIYFPTVDQLLEMPLSDKPDAFPPAHLNVSVLNKIGSLKVNWTEYMDDHLKFDVTTMTVSIFWFFSHISGNASWHLFCDRYGCSANHMGARRDRSRTRDLTYKQEVLHSYRWLFSSDAGEAHEQLLELPLPWWLVPLEDERLFSKAFRLATGKDASAGMDKRPTLRTLLKDSNGHKCELPMDCKELLEYLDEVERTDATEQLPYRRYPELGPRVRELMQFMEKQKPRGILALWRDKRDSNSWYTFWAAVVLGVAAFILALASVGLSGAQTWASFQALQKGS
ncbi:hypothetical protein HJFPF1_10858 [Paramyrothecium foliicola]|nr:hypothetical protein HJFPF1_10858 [Paramyrothecium foliicola]